MTTVRFIQAELYPSISFSYDVFLFLFHSLGRINAMARAPYPTIDVTLDMVHFTGSNQIWNWELNMERYHEF
jgi:hypothetical protein